MNTVKNLLSDIRKAKYAFALVSYNESDCHYIQLVKSDTIAQFKAMPSDTKVSYHVNESGDLFLG